MHRGESSGGHWSSTFGRDLRNNLATLDFQPTRLSGIRSPRCLTEENDFGMKTVGGQFQKAYRAQTQILVLRKGGAAAIE